MEQRRPRLGDILDDYCPRERRVTNHAVVAMIEDQIKQTRCGTCDAEHEYKAAKVPLKRRKKDAPAALSRQVLSGMPETAAPEARLGTNGSERAPAPSEPPAIEPEAQRPAERPAAAAAPRPAAAPGAGRILRQPPPMVAAPDEPQPDVPTGDEGPVHRPLIRATLPRTDANAPARATPEFTIRQGGRAGNFRDADARQGFRGPRPGTGNGGRPQGDAGPPRFARPARADRPGRPSPFGQNPGNRQADRSQPHSRSGRPAQFGKKRSK